MRAVKGVINIKCKAGPAAVAVRAHRSWSTVVDGGLASAGRGVHPSDHVRLSEPAHVILAPGSAERVHWHLVL